MKALIALAEGFEEVEALATADVLRRGGIETILASIDGSDPVVGAHGIAVESDDDIRGYAPSGIDAIILPGGMGGMQRLRASADVLGFVREMAESGRLVCAICAAPLVLSAAGVLKGRRATCYPGMEGELDCAERIVDMDVVEDGDIVTSRGPGTTFAFALHILARLAGKAKADEVAKGMLIVK